MSEELKPQSWAPDAVRKAFDMPFLTDAKAETVARVLEGIAAPAVEPVQSAGPVAWRLDPDGIKEDAIAAFTDEPGATPHIVLDIIEWYDTTLRAHQPQESTEPTFDLLAHIRRAMRFSERVFGPGVRTAGVIDHIRKELLEIEAAPLDLEEWIDVWMLALDGAWRSGATPEQIIAQIDAKQTKNEGRKWPDWRTLPRDKAIEHDRSNEGRHGTEPGGAG